MRLGLVARGEDRGLGSMLWAFYRYMQPERTLLVDMGAYARGFETHRDRFPDATVVDFNGGRLDEDAVLRWLDGLDVVYGAETWYSPAFPGWAAQKGVRTGLHVMPEFFTDQRADAVWLPTCWRAEMIPGARILPVPVDTDLLEPRYRDGSGGFLHVVGHRAAADRAGTTTLMRALRSVRSDVRLTVVTQDARLPTVRGTRGVDLRVITGSKLDRRELYALGDVLIAPRRYGGLSLPFNESAGSGLALALPACPPNPETWPCTTVRGYQRGRLRTPAGEVVLHDTDHRALAAEIDALAADPIRVAALSDGSLAWAATHSWERLRPLYVQAFEDLLA